MCNLATKDAKRLTKKTVKRFYIYLMKLVNPKEKDARRRTLNF